MTVQEAIKKIKSMPVVMFDDEGDLAKRIAIESMEEVEQYRALGTVEELKEAREKQVAKKILYRQGTLFKWIDTVRERGRYVNVPKWSNRDACPNCKKDILETNYCPNCGQALKCGEEDEND